MLDDKYSKLDESGQEDVRNTALACVQYLIDESTEECNDDRFEHWVNIKNDIKGLE